ncbi:iron-hydroxamate ABC transporter substrate-binding protein [Lentibacillus halophilus]|uniref:Iron-hydroxamate ABC transporter substrate-binding protein n=1 Tax=Lentibacillus halophilus TaxID=295065 RepID=A0ABP3J1R4_9BACI
MKKQLTFIIIILSLLVVLAACGDENNPDNNTNSDDKQENTDETKTFAAKNGDVEIPKNPKNIVTSDSYIGYLLALGIKPAGTSEFGLNVPNFEGMLDDVKSFGDRTNPSIEKIFDIDPDLIIIGSHIKDVEQLEKIAPVVVMERKGYKDMLRDFGEITGKQDKASAWINDWEKRMDELKPKVEKVIGDKTISILSPHAKGGVYAWGDENGRGGVILYKGFNRKAPEPIQKQLLETDERWMDVSMEKIPEFAGDIILTVPNDGDDADPSKVYDNPLWKDLPAVKNDQVYRIDDKVGSSFSDPITLEKRLDKIEKQILQQ